MRYSLRGSHLREIEIISQSVDNLLKRLNSAFRNEQDAKEKLIVAIRAQSQSELRNYRSQINPHFVFNTLECIRSMAHRHKQPDMETIISSMALMFRYSFYARDPVPLSQELENVSNFINVAAISYKENYSLVIRAGKEALQRKVLSMILQPLVENSIFHGFYDNTNQYKHILIRAFCDSKDGRLVVSVTDNGEGLSSECLAFQNKRLLMAGNGNAASAEEGALYNICQRMKLSFGANFDMKISSKKGKFTKVEMKIPEDPEFFLFLETNKEKPCTV
jgi:two-component system sensor histidine kinase YesM